MPIRDPRIDAYVAKAAPFARPVLSHLRKVIHAAVPDVEETIKWGMPHFLHGGILWGFAAFQAHCAFHVRGADDLLGEAASDDAMGQFGRIPAVSDLPPRATLAKVLKADLAAALKGNAKARATFEAFTWMVEGKSRNWKYEKC
jgi:uncharacterized protein YdhG (YjbR/CyaY superfamily)